MPIFAYALEVLPTLTLTIVAATFIDDCGHRSNFLHFQLQSSESFAFTFTFAANLRMGFGLGQRLQTLKSLVSFTLADAKRIDLCTGALDWMPISST